MAKAGYTLPMGAPVALSAGVAKTALCVICPASCGIDLTKMRLGFDGVTGSGVPVLVEFCDSTLATNSTPGTNNTTGTVTQVYGRAITAGFTGFYASTAEPTVLTRYDSWTLTPNGGLVIYYLPPRRTHDTTGSAGDPLRAKTPPPGGA